jgi:hypothetical protein
MRYVLILAVALVLGGCGVSDEDAGDGGADGDTAQADVGAPGTDATADDVEAAVGRPQLQLGANLLDFGNLDAGEQAVIRLVISNPGTETLRVTGFLLKGSAAFSLVRYDANGETTDVWSAWAGTEAGVTFAPPLSVGAGETSDVLGVRFAPPTRAGATAQLRLISNDAVHLGAGVVALRGNLTGPRLCVSPSAVDFGRNLVGSTATRQVTLENCGDGGDLTIHEIALSPDSGGPFSMDLGNPGAGAPKSVLAPQATKTFEVVYAPSVATPVGGDGWEIRETASLIFKTDALESDGQVVLSGSAGHVEGLSPGRESSWPRARRSSHRPSCISSGPNPSRRTARRSALSGG